MVGGQETQRVYIETVVHTDYKEKNSPHEGSQTLEQLTQRGCAVSVLGTFQDPTG